MLDRDLVLPNRIAGLAADHADDPAMVHVDGWAQTWRDLDDTARRWATALRHLGVGAGDTVATMLPNSFEAYHAWLGAARLRAVEVPMNNMYRGQMLRYIVNDSDAEVLVIAERFVDRLEQVAAELASLRTVVVPDASGPLPDLPFAVVAGDAFLDGVEPAVDLDAVEPWDTAALIYTSGTTGPSKGVLVPWPELHESARILPDDFLRTGDPYYSTFPAFHISGKVALYLAAIAGGHLLIREAFSLTEFWSDVRKHGVRAAALVGPMAAMLLAAPPADDDADNPLDRVMMGPVIPNIDDFKARFGVAHVATGFGSTEIGFPIASGYDPPNPRTCGRRRVGPPGYEVRIVDEHDDDVPIGTVGELVVRSSEPWVMLQGYRKMPDKTAEAWRNGWFHTGDAFVEDEEGWLYFVDRMKDSLRRRGENISSFEVEAGINAHPDVQECAVVGVPSDLGEDDVKAVVVPVSGSGLTPGTLLEWLVPRMPRFMLPRYVELVDALPRTDATLRVRKVELREDPVNERTWDREAVGFTLPKE